MERKPRTKFNSDEERKAHKREYQRDYMYKLYQQNPEFYRQKLRDHRKTDKYKQTSKKYYYKKINA